MIRKYARDDNGAIAVVVAVLVVVFMAVSMLVVDLGQMYDTRRQLQAVAEAGALAGCQELIATANVGAADAEARSYVSDNAAGGPLGGTVTVEQVDIDAGEGSVRVVVKGDAPGMFGAFFGNASYDVRAAAKARKWRLVGGRYLLPWALPIIRQVDRVEVVVDGPGGTWTTTLSEGADGAYSGTTLMPSGAGAPGAYDVFVRIRNTHGIVEQLVDSSGHEVPAAAAMVTGGDWPYQSVSLSDDFITAGDTGSLPYLTVRTVEPEPGGLRVYVDGKSRAMTTVEGSGDTLFRYQFVSADVPDSLDLLTAVPLDVRIGNETRNINEAYLHVRRSTHPVDLVSVSPDAVVPGGTIGVTVDLAEYDPSDLQTGQTYTLRVGSPSAQVGNYAELNFNKIQHTGSCPPDLVDPGSGNNYFDWLAYGYLGGIHVGDIIDTSPGGSGVNTQKALNERADFDPSMNVAVPVVEKYEEKSGGTYEVIVVDFAAFHITSYDKAGNVEGVFLEYIANPSSYADDPGGDDTSIYAARLVNP